MDLKEQLRRRRKDYRWIVGGLAVLLLVFTGVYYLIQRSRDLPAALVRNRVLLFVLWYINLVLILAILFVLFRNLVKLVLERHNRILGSKFKTKLVATYIGLTLVPVLLLFLYASELLQGWIDRWFNTAAVKQVLEQGYSVAEAMNDRITATNLRDAEWVRREIEPFDLRSARARPALARRMQQLLDELDLDLLAVYEGTDFVHAVLNPQAGLTDLPEPGWGFLGEAATKGHASRVLNLPHDQGRLVLAAATSPGAREPPVVVVAGSLLDPVLANQSEQLIQAYQGYRQLEVQKGDIKASYLLTFLMVTLLILLTSSWVGLYLARRVTVPIQALAEGTRRISTGDLEHRVQAAADDELGVLVDSFNRMTDELRSNKRLLEESHREMVDTNRRLAEERALIAAVLANMAAGVISVDRDGRIFSCNEAALQMLRLREPEVVGRPVAEALQEGDRRKLAALFAAEPTADGRTSHDLRLILRGEWKAFEAKLTSMLDDRGEPVGRVMVLEDLTELIKAQQLAAWREAARRIAHEIKNPLTPIKLSAERIEKRSRQASPEMAAAIEEGVGIIVREVETMKAMVDEFSRFARMPRPQPVEVDLAKLVHETLHLYQGLKPGVEVVGELADGAEAAWFDPEQVKRALINLLDNAVEATEPPGEVRLAVARRDDHLEIRVADTGAGIAAEDKDKLFLPYFSTKGRGTGLGLAIVHRIVADHQGTIRIEDNHPHGSIFTIELPVA